MPDDLPHHRTARALYPHRPEMWEPEFLYEPLPVPEDHPELNLFEPQEAQSSPGAVRTAPPSRLDEPMPARMLNEFVYCPRLFYEYVEGVFVRSEDTERGASIHRKVDRGRGDLLPASNSGAVVGGADPGTVAGGAEPGSGIKVPCATPVASESSPDPQVIHSRSATLGSERLGVVAKLDLIEVEVARDPIAEAPATPSAADDLFALAAARARPTSRRAGRVTPVDYKVGRPRAGEDGNELWDADKMQLGLQILILRDNGYVCDEGVIFYRETKQRVRLAMTAELETWILERIAQARETAAGRHIPPPLQHSPKCVRCSLAPVCLPDETRLAAQRPTTLEADAGWKRLADGGLGPPASGRATNLSASASRASVRRLIAARDDTRALYLNTQGLRVGKTGEVLVVKDGDRTVDSIRMMDVSHVALFGNIQLSTQAVQALCEAEIPVAWFSMGGWFYGLTRGHGLTNIFTRIEQFRLARAPHHSLELARRFIHGKIRNQRTMLMRLHVEPPEPVVLKLRRAALDALEASSIESLLGIEGAAAAMYFQHFAGMIKVQADPLEDDDIPGLEEDPAAVAERRANEQAAARETFTFDFTKRTRRPPTDPVNALLSLAYSLLSKDCTIAVLATGFDPYLGFYHQPRYGRPALALDLMEEFRPLIAESAVLSAINNRMITSAHFVRAGEAVNLSPAGRKVFFQAYEQRINSLITHPVFDYKVSYRRVLELQARMLARHLTGEIPEYIPMMTR